MVFQAIGYQLSSVLSELLPTQLITVGQSPSVSTYGTNIKVPENLLDVVYVFKLLQVVLAQVDFLPPIMVSVENYLSQSTQYVYDDERHVKKTFGIIRVPSRRRSRELYLRGICRHNGKSSGAVLIPVTESVVEARKASMASIPMRLEMKGDPSGGCG
jgi:hypothetical protein